MEEDWVENFRAKTPSQATYFLSMFLYCHIILFFFSFPFLFPGILGNDSLWFPFPKFGNGFFSFPSHSRSLGMAFSHSLPVLELLEGVFFHSLSVPEFWDWNYPFSFPFPNAQKSFPLTPEPQQVLMKPTSQDLVTLWNHPGWGRLTVTADLGLI